MIPAIIGNYQHNIQLSSDITIALDFDIPEGKNVEFKLNDYEIKNPTSKKFTAASSVKMTIASEKDMITANTFLGFCNKEQPCSVCWKLKKDIELSKNVSISYPYYTDFTFDGQNYTITASNSEEDVAAKGQIFGFAVGGNVEKNITLKNLNLKIKDGFANGVIFNRIGTGAVNAELDNISVIADRTKAPKKIDDKTELLVDGDGTLIQNNSCDITVKNKLSLTTDAYNWNGIDVDSSIAPAVLTFTKEGDDKASVEIVDNRSDAKKATEPFIGFDGEDVNKGTVNNAEDVGLNFVESGGERWKGGYEFGTLTCIYNGTVKAGEDQLLVLGNALGKTFDITGNTVSGFVFADKNGKYLGFNKGAIVAESTTPYTWKYDGGLYAEVKTTTRSGSLFWSRTVTAITKYYLAVDNGELVLTNNKTTAAVRVITEHTPEYVKVDADTHKIVCKVCNAVLCTEEHKYDNTTHQCKCGAYDPKACCISNVNVTYKRAVSYTGFGFWKRASYSYQFTVKPAAQLVGVKTVMISADGVNWKYGTTFTSSLIPATLYIKVIDTNKVETKWKWDAKTNKVTKDELYVTIGGTQYAFEDGWTWNDFVTNYSSVGFATSGNYVLLNSEALKEMASAVFPKPTDTIVAFVEYKLMAE